MASGSFRNGGGGGSGTPGENGANGFARLTEEWVIPSFNTANAATVDNAALFPEGVPVYVQGAGFFVSDGFAGPVVTLRRTGPFGNSGNIAIGALVIVAGPTGGNAFLRGFNEFIMPEVGADETIISFGDLPSWMFTGLVVAVEGGGLFEVITYNGDHTATLRNLGIGVDGVSPATSPFDTVLGGPDKRIVPVARPAGS